MLSKDISKAINDRTVTSAGKEVSVSQQINTIWQHIFLLFELLSNLSRKFKFIFYIYTIQAIHFFSKLPCGFYVPSRPWLRISWITIPGFDRATLPSFRLINTQNRALRACHIRPSQHCHMWVETAVLSFLFTILKPRWPVVISKGKEMLHSLLLLGSYKQNRLLITVYGGRHSAFEGYPVSRRLSYSSSTIGLIWSLWTVPSSPSSPGILEESMGARNRVGIGLS